jgi:hypothetical protein
VTSTHYSLGLTRQLQAFNSEYPDMLNTVEVRISLYLYINSSQIISHCVCFVKRYCHANVMMVITSQLSIAGWNTIHRDNNKSIVNRSVSNNTPYTISSRFYHRVVYLPHQPTESLWTRVTGCSHRGHAHNTMTTRSNKESCYTTRSCIGSITTLFDVALTEVES